MKIVLHIGNSKAASTSIQENLFALRNILAQSGILVPAFGAKMIRPRLLADMLFGIGDPDKNEFLRQSISTQINTHQPELVVLSSEHLLSGVSHLETSDFSRIDGLRNQLAVWTTDIQVHALIRDPVSLYRSFAQQMLKATDFLDNPVTWRTSHIPAIPVWKSVFGSSLQLVPFQKTSLKDQDGVKDFLHRYCPMISTQINAFDVIHANSTECAEVTAILQKYFFVNYPGQTRIFRNDATSLLSALSHTARTLGIGTPPRLNDQVAEMILFNHADQIRILQDDYGVVFENIDGHHATAKPTSAFSFTGQFSDICQCDAKVIDTLLHATRRQFTQRDASP